MPRRHALAHIDNLKALLGRNGLAWPDQENVLPRQAQDRAVRLGLHNLLGLAAPLRPADVQAEMVTVFEQATRLFVEKNRRGQEINEVDFVREVWAGHRLYLHVGVALFAKLFAALLRARSDHHEGNFQRTPHPPLLGMAIDTFVDTSRGFFGGELLSFYIDQGVMDADNNGEQEEEVRQNGEQATAHHAFTFELPLRSISFAEASTSYHASNPSVMSAPRPAPACVESPEYDSDEFAGVSTSEDEEEEREMGTVAAGVQAMALDEAGDVAMGE